MTDVWRIGHQQREYRFPSFALLRTYVVFREWLTNWPWKEAHIVDVGACAGSFALAAAQTQPQARITALEPWPAAWTWLVDNRAAQFAPRWTNVQAAATDHTRKLAMHEGPKWGMSSLYGQGAAVMVDGITLDGLLAGPVTLFKLDVEGHELEALRGAERLLTKFHPRIIVELRADMQTKAGHGPDELENYLIGHDYQYKTLLTKQDWLFSVEKATVG